MRRARAALKSALKAGRLDPRQLVDAALGDPGSPAGSLRVTDFLLSLPAMGQTKADQALDELGISWRKRVGGLGAVQAVRLRAFLEARDARRAARLGIRRSRLVVLAGPTAVGKGTVAGYIRRNHPDVLLSVSATTREPRPGEVDGVDYYFVSDAEFDRMIRDGELLEWATVHGAHRYGTPRKPVEDALAAGRSVLLEIDLQGARSVRRAMPDAVLVFLAPPSWDELVRRLTKRGTEDPAEQGRRLETAKVELAAEGEFDHVVVNRDVGEAAQQVVDLMDAR